MSSIIIPKKELRSVVKESVREVLGQEIMKLHALFLSPISQKEQRDVEKRYGKPVRRVAKSVEAEL